MQKLFVKVLMSNPDLLFTSQMQFHRIEWDKISNFIEKLAKELFGKKWFIMVIMVVQSGFVLFTTDHIQSLCIYPSLI